MQREKRKKDEERIKKRGGKKGRGSAWGEGRKLKNYMERRQSRGKEHDEPEGRGREGMEDKRWEEWERKGE